MRSKESKTFLITLQPEWLESLDRLKQEQFYNVSKAEMMRYVISKGLEAIKASKQAGAT